MDTLFDIAGDPATSELRDPGLYPGVQFFVSNWLTGYLPLAPGRINALVSGYNLLTNASALADAKADVVHARTLFLDSGAISTLLACLRGSGKAEDVHAWLPRTPELVALAHQLHDAGAPPGVVAAMDLPAYADMLGAAGISVEEAEAITLANAATMLAQEVPPGWQKVFTSQGVTLADHERCMASYEQLGVLAAVRAGTAWLAVGGMAFEDQMERVHQVHARIRQLVGDTGHIHALGVSRLPVLVPMLRRGWVQSADSSSPAQEIRFNRGAYQLRGPRPTFLANALHAANALYAEAELAQAIERDKRTGDVVQVSWLDDAAAPPIPPAEPVASASTPPAPDSWSDALSALEALT